MKKLLLAFVTLFFCINSAYSSIPTIEGLFRNSNSKDLEGDLIVLKILATVEKKNEIAEEIKVSDRFYKLIFSQENEKRSSLLQVRYEKPQMSKSDVTEVKFFRDFERTITSDKSVEKKLYYSLISMFSLNSSKLIKDLLKKNDSGFKSNREIMNRDKVKLYDDYKRYLQTIKEDETLKEDLASPLKPEEEELKEKVTNTLKDKMYVESNNLKLIRKDKKFFWEMKLDKVKALFTNEEHRLVSLEIMTAMGVLKVECFDYISFNGRQEVPKKIYITDLNNQKVKVQIVDYKNFINKSKKSINERVSDYRKYEAENTKSKMNAKVSQEESTIVEELAFPML